MPQMLGLPTSGQPFATPIIVANPAQRMVEKQAEHKMAVESEIKHGSDIPLNEPAGIGEPLHPKENELLEAIKERDEADKLLELAQSPKDKAEAEELVKFWQGRVDKLNAEIIGIKQPKPLPVQESRVIEVPELPARITESAQRRVKYPRNKRHKVEKKKAKKVSWLAKMDL